MRASPKPTSGNASITLAQSERHVFLTTASEVWQNPDVYHPMTNYYYEPHDISVATDGRIWVTGYGLDHGGRDRIWLTQKLDVGIGQCSVSEELSNSDGADLATNAAGTVFSCRTSQTWLWTIRALVW